jgi:hypothetical protein
MESIEKAPEIKEAEKIKGIVKIGFNDEPKKKVKKKVKKHFFVENDILAEKSIKGDFDKKIPIQNIKPKKKVHYKPFVSEIQEEKAVENTEKIETDDLDNLKKEIKTKELLLNLMKKSKELEQKIIKKELKLKKKAEKKERRRKHWYFRMFMRKEKSKEIPKEVYSKPNEVKLIEANDTILKFCPVCQAKMKRQKVKQELDTFRQIFKCKKCPFQKEIIIKL